MEVGDYNSLFVHSCKRGGKLIYLGQIEVDGEKRTEYRCELCGSIFDSTHIGKMVYKPEDEGAF